MKSKLIGSHSSLENLAKEICKYFYSNISLVKIGLDEWECHNSKGKIDGFRIKLKKGRYRFELIPLRKE